MVASDVNILALATAEAQTLLQKAEVRFGPRDASWRFVGVLSHEDGPILHFPGPKSVTISITPRALQDSHQRQFQLAHEVVHLLSPQMEFEDATLLEEGAAVRFSIDGPAYQNPLYRELAEAHIRDDPRNGRYCEALEIADRILSVSPDGIRHLRQIEPAFGAISPKLLMEHFGLPAATADRACQRVSMRPR